MSLSEAITNLEILGGPADQAVHRHILEAGASLVALQQMIQMRPEDYAAWVYSGELPSNGQPDQETAVEGTSNLVDKHAALLKTTQEDWAGHQADVARGAAEAAQTFGRVQSAGGSAAIQALPPQPPRNTAMWN